MSIVTKGPKPPRRFRDPQDNYLAMNKGHRKWNIFMIYAGAALVCFGLTYILLGLWQADLRIPFAYGGGDELPICLWIKGLKDNPWIFHNSRVGAPFGLEMFNYPLPDSFHLVIFKLLGMTTRYVGKVLNLFYLATYPAILLCSLYSLRKLGFGYPAALLSSFLYTFLPYHFMRQEAHLFLSAYYAVPLVVLVAFRLFSENPPFASPRQATAGFGARLRHDWGVIVICVIAGSTGSGYYPFFGCALLAVGGVAAAVRRQRPAPLLSAMAMISLIGITLALSIAPNILYGRGEAASRPAASAEVYGLKIAQLLLPITQHRLPLFARIKARYNDAPLVNENDTATLGMFGAAGFLFLLGWIGFRLMRPASLSFKAEDKERFDCAALLLLAATLLGTIGGFGSLFAVLVHPQFRCYNRISVYIAFLSLFAIGYLIDRTLGTRIRTNRANLLYCGVLVLFGVGGILDQTTPRFEPDYRGAKTSFEQDDAFVHNIEAVVPADSMIFQLPYTTFPESGGIHKMTSYDLLRGYVHSQKLRWSFGAMKGERGDAWQQAVSAESPESMVQKLVFADFSGIYMDRFGYADNGAQCERDLTQVLGEGPVITSPRLLFFSLENYKTTLRKKLSDTEWRNRREHLWPLFVLYDEGFYAGESSPGRVWRWSRGESSLRIVNLSGYPKPLLFEVTLATAHDEYSSIRIMSSVLTRDLRVNRAGVHVKERVVAPVGETEVRFSSDAPRAEAPGDPRVMIFGIENLTLREEPTGTL
jgi:phosphoglycerol transferase